MNKDPSGSESKTYLWGLQVDALSYIEALNLAISAAEKVFEVINRKPMIDSNDDQGAKPDKFLGHIKFQDVSL